MTITRRVARLASVLCLAFLAPLAARAELVIEITQGVDDPTPIAIVPFAGTGAIPEDIAGVVQGDLARSGQFDPAQVAIQLDVVTVAEGDLLPGRINVNTCPRELLLGLELEAEQVDAILEARLQPDQDLSSPAWLLNVLEPAEFATVVDRVTTRSDQFTVHAVALLNDRPRFRRVEVLIDRNFVPVRVLLWRDLTPLGFPLPEERGEELP